MKRIATALAVAFAISLSIGAADARSAGGGGGGGAHMGGGFGGGGFAMGGAYHGGADGGYHGNGGYHGYGGFHGYGHNFHDFHGCGGWCGGTSIYFAWPWYGWGWPYYYPDYYASAYPVYPAAAPPAGSWYRCDDPPGYYPYVPTCNNPWQAVPFAP